MGREHRPHPPGAAPQPKPGGKVPPPPPPPHFVDSANNVRSVESVLQSLAQTDTERGASDGPARIIEDRALTPGALPDRDLQTAIDQVRDDLEAYNAASDALVPGAAQPQFEEDGFAMLSQHIVRSPDVAKQTLIALTQMPERNRELALSALMRGVFADGTTIHANRKRDVALQMLAGFIPQNGPLSIKMACTKAFKDICNVLARPIGTYLALSAGESAVAANASLPLALASKFSRSVGLFVVGVCAIALITGVPQVFSSCRNVLKAMRNQKETIRIASVIGREISTGTAFDRVDELPRFRDMFISAGLSRATAERAILSGVQGNLRGQAETRFRENPPVHVMHRGSL